MIPRILLFSFALLAAMFFPVAALADDGPSVSHWLGMDPKVVANIAALVIVLGPIVGNLLAHAALSIGMRAGASAKSKEWWLNLSAGIARWTPFATKAASVALTAPTQAEAFRAVAAVAKDEPGFGPISQAAELLMSVPPSGDKTPILPALPTPPKLPLPCLLMAVFFGIAAGVVACGPAQHPCVNAYDKARTLDEIAEVDKECGHMLLDGAGGDAGTSSSSGSGQ